MTELILILIIIFTAANGNYTLLWIAGGLLALVLIASLFGGKGKAPARGQRRARIDHPHLIDAEDYECPACGARFDRNVMACPRCGARFDGTRTDYEEFDEEEDEWEAWDEEDGL